MAPSWSHAAAETLDLRQNFIDDVRGSRPQSETNQARTLLRVRKTSACHCVIAWNTRMRMVKLLTRSRPNLACDGPQERNTPGMTATDRGVEQKNFLRLAGSCELPVQRREALAVRSSGSTSLNG